MPTPTDAPHAPPAPAPGRIDRWLLGVTRFAFANPWRVLGSALLLLALCWGYASRLEVRGDFLELIPTESESARLFRATLHRMGGAGATLSLVVRSPDAAANQRLVDALVPRLRALPSSMVQRVEFGPGEARQFFMDRRWLYADVADLEEVECELARARRRHVPGFVDLDDEPCTHRPAEPPAPGATPDPPEPPVHSDLPFETFRRRLRGRMRDADQFPTGYFRTPDGHLFDIVMRTPGTGTGDAAGDVLVRRVEALVAEVNPRSFHPQAEVGLAGDIPSAIAERDAIVKDVALSSGTALALILLAIVFYFRSIASLVHIGIAMFTGVGVAFAFAMGAFGYLNASTAFLGSIIAGNGINYTIIYVARFRERRLRGDAVLDALCDAALTSRVGTQLGALASAGAYGSLTFTSFRGFSQFGYIGGIGMVACWVATMTLVPASVTVFERLRARRAKAVDGDAAPAPTTLRSPVTGFVGRLTERWPAAVLAVGLVLTVVAAVKLPTYLHDPWEYNFSNLGSKHSRHSGADAWNSEQDKILTARGSSPDMLLADSMDEVIPLVAALRERDRDLHLIDRIETVYDRLGGTPDVVARKLELLGLIRGHIDAVMPYLGAADTATAHEWRPPESLRAVRPEELPSLVRAQFTEVDGRFGTPFFVYYVPRFSPNDGRQLMVVARLTINLRLADGRVVPTVSRATVFAEMVASMGRDGPRATLLAFLAVVLVVVLALRRPRPALAILGSLLSGVLLTVGGAAWLKVRLNFLNFVALPLTFGIGVEYAINLYDRIRHYDGDTSAALRSVGGAVFLCSLTTIIGYGALLTADSMALGSFGYYAMAGELACITTALLLLPAALRAGHRKP